MAATQQNEQSLESRLLRLKSQVDILAKRQTQAQWELDRELAALKSEFGLDTAEQAEQEAARLELEAAELRAQLVADLDAVEHEHAELLAMANGGAA